MNYSGTVRLSTPDLHDYNLLNARQKLEYERLAGLFTDTSPSTQYTLDKDYARIYNDVQRGVETDWLSKPLRNAISQSHSLSVDGGDDRAKYNLGIRYGKDAGVMKGSDRTRLSTISACLTILQVSSSCQTVRHSLLCQVTCHLMVTSQTGLR